MHVAKAWWFNSRQEPHEEPGLGLDEEISTLKLLTKATQN